MLKPLNTKENKKTKPMLARKVVYGKCYKRENPIPTDRNAEHARWFVSAQKERPRLFLVIKM
jgi:hypothetical protein